MAGQSAVGALHAGGVFEEIAAESAAHNVVKRLLDEFVTILLNDFLLLLANGALSAETDIERPAFFCLFGCKMSVLDL